MNSTPTVFRLLGTTGPKVFPIALGCMGMSGMYGPSDEDESIATIHAALDAGINLFDTGDFYGMGHNEMLLGRALKGRRDRAILSVKFGAQRAPGGAWTGVDNSPRALKSALAYSLTRLGVDYIDVYRPARLDPNVPIEETLGALVDMLKAGYIRHIGLSEVGVDTLRRAAAVHPVVDLQIEYAVVSRSPEEKILPVVSELGMAVTAYGVLSRGLLSGSVPTAKTDYRAHLPRFTGDNQARNQTLVEALRDIARDKGATATQLAVAWVLSRGNNMVPVLGARTRKQLTETLGALDVTLTADDHARIEAAVPPGAIAGTRYAVEQMKALDSER